MKWRIKPSVVVGLYVLSLGFVLVLGGIVAFNTLKTQTLEPNFSYISKGILDYEKEVKVVNVKNYVGRPYNDQNVKIVKNFYDYQGDSKSQEQSLIFFEDTYIQSSGVAYSSGKVFDVISILPGTVKEVKEDSIVGNSITIEHDNGIYSMYQSVSDMTVKEGDHVDQGAVIAKSSTSNIEKDLDNHLYFEIIIDGVSVNPENYYNKTIDDIKRD